MHEIVREDNWFQEMEGIKTMYDFQDLLDKTQSRHENPKRYGEMVGLVLLGLEKRSEEEKILTQLRMFCKFLQNLESRIHDTNAEAHLCLKQNLKSSEYAIYANHLDISLSSRLLEFYYQIMRDYLPCCTSPDKEKPGFLKKLWIQLKKMLKIAMLNLDVIKDTWILIILVRASGGIPVFVDSAYFYIFQVQFVIHWLLSITIPCAFNTARILYTNPYLCFGATVDHRSKNFNIFQKLAIQLLCGLVLFPLLPGMILYGSEEEKEKLSKEALEYIKALRENTPTDKIQNIKKSLNRIRAYLEKTKLVILNIRRLESLENSCQIILNAVMLLLFYSTTNTKSGLQSIFGEENKNPIMKISNEIFLVLSILLTLNKTTRTILKTKKEEIGDVMGFKTKIILGLRGFLISSIRTLCVISFFTPHLGLWNIYHHLEVIISFCYQSHNILL